MTLGRLVLALRAGWVLVSVAALLGLTLGAVAAAATPNTYAATATIALRWDGPQPGVAELANVRYLTREAENVALLAKRPEVLAALDDPPSRADARAWVPSDSQLVLVEVSAGRPAEAARLATELAEEMVAFSAEGDASTSADTVLAVAAPQPSKPVAPRLSLYLLVGLVAGVLVGGAAALVVHRSPAPADARWAAADINDTWAFRASYLVWALLVAAVIPWRTGTFYAGGADPVVLAKAALSVAALAISVWLAARAARAGRLRPIATAPVVLLVLYLLVTVIGGVANHSVTAAGVVAVRVGILAVTVCLLVSSFAPRQVAASLMRVLGALVMLAAVSGLASFSGRLRGTIPPMNPNLLALIASLVAIWLLALVLTGRDHLWCWVALAGCLGVVVLTGSRTALAALVATGAVMFVRVTALRLHSVMVLVLAIPPVTFVLLGTDLLASMFTRGGEESLASLSNRTIAWQAALGMDRDGWQTWFGQGLAHKEVSVPGQWWDTQMLDSTWVSALVQGGYFGLALVVALALATLARALFAPRAEGPVWFGLVLYLSLGGFLESGLFDGTIQFLVFLVAALAVFESGPHQRPSTLEPAGRPIAEATSEGSASAIVA